MTLALRFAARSDVGLLRDDNEDSVYAGPRLLAVADGMGGHAAGEVASVGRRRALAAPRRGRARRRPARRAGRPRCYSANGHLRDMVERRPRPARHGHHAHRAARRRAPGSAWCTSATRAPTCCATASCTQITHDHTFVQTLRRRGPHHRRGGRPPPAAALHHAGARRARRTSSPTSRCARPSPATATCCAATGCPAWSAEDTLARDPAPRGEHRTAVDRLVELALQGGGPDNITAIVADVVEVDDQSRRRPCRSAVGAAADGAVRHDRGQHPRGAGSRAAAGAASSSTSTTRTPTIRRAAPRPADRCCCSLLLARARRRSGRGLALVATSTQYYVGARRRRTSRSSAASRRTSDRCRRPRSTAPRTSRCPTCRRTQQEQVQAGIAAERSRRRRADRRTAARAGRAAARRAASAPTLADPVGQPVRDRHAQRLRRARQPSATPTPTPTPTTDDGILDDASDCGDRLVNPRAGRPEPEPRDTELVLLVFAAGHRRWLPTPRSAWPTTARCPPACSATPAASRCSSASPTSRCASSRRYADPLAAAVRRVAQRPRPGADLPARPGATPSAPRSSARRPAAALRLQLIWTAVGVVAVRRGAAAWSATTACCSATPTPRASPAWSCCCCPLLPAIGSDRSTAPGSGSGSAGFSFQPGEFAKIAADRLLRRLPGRQARRALAGQPARRSASTCPAAATSARCSSPGSRASRCSSSSATSAPRCCSSASSS